MAKRTRVKINGDVTADGRTQVSARDRAKAWLLAHGSPRFLMSMMLASTIGCGFWRRWRCTIWASIHRSGVTRLRCWWLGRCSWAGEPLGVAVRRQNARADEQASRALAPAIASRLQRSDSRSSFDLPGEVVPADQADQAVPGSSWAAGGGGRFGGGGSRVIWRRAGAGICQRFRVR